MRKQVKISMERFKLLRHVLKHAQFLTSQPKGMIAADNGKAWVEDLAILKNAVAAVNLHEARAVADQFESGHIRGRGNRKREHPDDLRVMPGVKHTEEI